MRHLRRCEELLLVLKLDIVWCHRRRRTPLLIDGALLASFIMPLLLVIAILMASTFQITALLSPAHLVFLVNALRQLSYGTV